MLISLPPSYENFRCAIESRDELPTPDTLKIRIMEEFNARRPTSKENPPGAMFIQKTQRQSRDPPKQGEKKKTEPPIKFRCFKCKKPGHKAAECRTKTLPSLEQRAGKAQETAFASRTSVKETAGHIGGMASETNHKLDKDERAAPTYLVDTGNLKKTKMRRIRRGKRHAPPTLIARTNGVSTAAQLLTCAAIRIDSRI
ncbi:hypothetical protein ALC57_10186 [Trachymyrmex cornetzi]|uniref:CCHC-type domain-containing protein n=1 Tax=Trachymyrmex cornetzi TaxID=471704 RepID=A0A151J4I3_9HYME|nr:hypothetical protein ALC57_10186 [Trachymyrmex cornetzi]